MQTRYVVDTNIIVQWLLKPDGLAGKIIKSSELELFTPNKAIDELWENSKDWIGKKIDMITTSRSRSWSGSLTSLIS